MADRLRPEDTRARYEGLRQLAFSCTLELGHLDPASFADGAVFGAVMEFTVDTGSVTFFCCYEQGAGKYVHVAMYTSSGFGIIGENFPPKVFILARRFLQLLDEHRGEMKPARDFSSPRAKRTKFYAFTNSGTLTMEASPGWLGGAGRYGLLVNAGHEVLLEMQKVVPTKDAPLSQGDWAACESDDAETCIAGCSAIIAAGKEPAKRLAEAFVRRGVAKMGKGELRAAEKDFGKALRRHANYPAAYYHRGLCRADLGEVDRAVADLNEAAARDPENALIYYNRGRMLIGRGDRDMAQGDIEAAIRLKPDFADAYFERGNLRSAQADVAGAIKDYDECLRLDPTIHEALVCRGNAYNRLGEFGRAVKDLDAAIQAHPDWPIAFNNRGNARLGLGDYGLAIADYNSALALNAGDAVALVNRASAHRALRDYDSAEADLSAAIKRASPYAVAALQNRGLLFRERGRLVEALADFNDAIALGPVRSDYLRARGELRRQMGDETGATSDLDAAARLGPSDKTSGNLGASFLDASDFAASR